MSDKVTLEDAEVPLVLAALDRKIWSMSHVGMRDDDPRKAKYIALRRKIRSAF